jgi:short-subunit dehydrogenase
LHLKITELQVLLHSSEKTLGKLTKACFFRNKGDYHWFTAYSNSKLANIYFTLSLQQKLASQKKQITTYSLHPGAVATDLGRHSFILNYLMSIAGYFFIKTSEEGAQTTLYCALQPGIEANAGKVTIHSEKFSRKTVF